VREYLAAFAQQVERLKHQHQHEQEGNGARDEQLCQIERKRARGEEF